MYNTGTLTMPLEATDLCDRCGARAYVRVRLSSGGELFFCAHHGREHTPKLADDGAQIQDESDKVTPKGKHQPGSD